MFETSPNTEATDLYVPAPATLLAGRDLTATERLLTLRREDSQPLGHAPGQFVQVSIFGMEEAPISICSAARDDDPSFQLCVRRIGQLTTALHALEVGGAIGIRGAFGRGFPVDEMAGQDVLFIAGGIGLAPMRSLIQHCLAHRGRFGRLALLYGAKQPAELLFSEDLQQWGRSGDIDVQLVVDAGDADWTGRVGLITELVKPVELDTAGTVAVVVGPPVMYRFVIEQLTGKDLPPERIILSLERHMRCGVGKCGHCMIEDLYCCQDGPVFKLSELAGVKGAI